MTNIIFLDIDGVLNDGNYIEKCYERHHQPMSMDFVPFNPRSLDNLRKIYDSILDNDNEPLVVLSSTWRLNEQAHYIVNARLAEYGIYVKETTPYINQHRGTEIIKWLEDHNHLDSPFVILDDDSFDIKCFEELKPHFVHTSFKRGLISWKAKQACDILLNKGGLNETRDRIKSGIY